MIEEINKYVYLALLAERGKSYQDMRFYLEKYILKKQEDISIDERNLLLVAYKNILSEKRQCLRTITSIENKEKKEEAPFLDYINEYKESLLTDLKSTCEYICLFIETYLLPFSVDDGAKTFYLKSIGDYYRYIAENIDSEKKNVYAEKSLSYYNKARESSSNILILDPVRLGLALNMSVFYYEILNNHETACHIAKETLDLVKYDLENLEENHEDNIDIFNIVNMLQENLNMWNFDEH